MQENCLRQIFFVKYKRMISLISIVVLKAETDRFQMHHKIQSKRTE